MKETRFTSRPGQGLQSKPSGSHLIDPKASSFHNEDASIVDLINWAWLFNAPDDGSLLPRASATRHVTDRGGMFLQHPYQNAVIGEA